ncbi:hypothetical protein [Bradyrhizobium embrapense]
MLVITVDLVPGGYEPMRRTIAAMRIANISDLADISDYQIVANETSNPLSGTPPRTIRCLIQAHSRRQSVWALIATACEEITKSDPPTSSGGG